MKRTGKATGIMVIFLLSACLAASGQPVNRITGIIIDSVNGSPVEYAHILNFSLSKQIYSNSKGEFGLDAYTGDTLVVYGLGYLYEKVIVNENMLSGKTVKIFLTQQPYDLSSANIIGIANYEDFRNKLINEPPPKTRNERLNESLASPVLRAALEGFQEYQQKHPTIARIPIRTPEEIERIKLDKIKHRDHVKDQVYHKFNPVIVKEITGLSEDHDIIEFMVYCNFTDSYILESNVYELAERIAAKFELFMKKKQEEKLKNDPVNFVEHILQPFA